MLTWDHNRLPPYQTPDYSHWIQYNSSQWTIIRLKGLLAAAPICIYYSIHLGIGNRCCWCFPPAIKAPLPIFVCSNLSYPYSHLGYTHRHCETKHIWKIEENVMILFVSICIAAECQFKNPPFFTPSFRSPDFQHIFITPSFLLDTCYLPTCFLADLPYVSSSHIGMLHTSNVMGVVVYVRALIQYLPVFLDLKRLTPQLLWGFIFLFSTTHIHVYDRCVNITIDPIRWYGESNNLTQGRVGCTVRKLQIYSTVESYMECSRFLSDYMRYIHWNIWVKNRCSPWEA